ncbi:ERF family protein [Bartonella tamiae]|uniref:ERF superfamily protein n=1 Tax=Bartonella tamiae Th239 TaxID=1094558 RepID=J1K2D6_9HYPH|nr:ERF family protein [Bartonella tamiae]EJF91647.1 hypothetical protein ME5_00026 [Bartonella tamiae Th239]
MSQALQVSEEKTHQSGLMEIVANAVANNASVEIITKLMDAQERYDSMQARRQFDIAMAKAMGEIPSIKKNKKIGFTNKNGNNSTQYMHEDLAEIAKTIKPILKKYGLSYRFKTAQEGAVVKVTCIVSHESGYSEENSLSAHNDNTGNKNSIQAIGSTVTYLERYTLKAALGLAASEDDDAQSVHDNNRINQDQFTKLNEALDRNEIDKAKFCAYLGVDAVANIPANKFEQALKAINKSITQKAQAHG